MATAVSVRRRAEEMAWRVWRVEARGCGLLASGNSRGPGAGALPHQSGAHAGECYGDWARCCLMRLHTPQRARAQAGTRNCANQKLTRTKPGVLTTRVACSPPACTSLHSTSAAKAAAPSSPSAPLSNMHNACSALPGRGGSLATMSAPLCSMSARSSGSEPDGLGGRRGVDQEEARVIKSGGLGLGWGWLNCKTPLMQPP